MNKKIEDEDDIPQFVLPSDEKKRAKQWKSDPKMDSGKKQSVWFILHSMEKKVDFSPISWKKAPFNTRNGHF